MPSDTASPSGRPNCSAGRPCSYRPWPASCRMPKKAALKSVLVVAGGDAAIVRTQRGAEGVGRHVQPAAVEIEADLRGRRPPQRLLDVDREMPRQDRRVRPPRAVAGWPPPAAPAARGVRPAPAPRRPSGPPARSRPAGRRRATADSPAPRPARVSRRSVRSKSGRKSAKSRWARASSHACCASTAVRVNSSTSAAGQLDSSCRPAASSGGW